MTWEEAEYDKRRNVLLQCIGATQNVEIEVYEGETGSEDGFCYVQMDSDMRYQHGRYLKG